jgi:Family of unknown function (DUF6163)
MLFGLDPRAPRATSRTTAKSLPQVLDAVPWTRFLVWLMRVLSLLWLLKGIMGWAAILGIGALPPSSFETLSLMQQTTTGCFAVFDVVAGVGLWMASGWGAVMWLIATAAHLAISHTVPRALMSSSFTTMFFTGLIILFMFTVWAALRQSASAPATNH